MRVTDRADSLMGLIHFLPNVPHQPPGVSEVGWMRWLARIFVFFTNKRRPSKLLLVEGCSSEGLGVTLSELNLTLDFDRDVERQFGHSDCTASVSALLRTKHFDDEVGESVDDRGLLVEPGG